MDSTHATNKIHCSMGRGMGQRAAKGVHEAAQKLTEATLTEGGGLVATGAFPGPGPGPLLVLVPPLAPGSEVGGGAFAAVAYVSLLLPEG